MNTLYIQKHLNYFNLNLTHLPVQHICKQKSHFLKITSFKWPTFRSSHSVSFLQNVIHYFFFSVEPVVSQFRTQVLMA
jgi:hypothetical protein